MKRSFGTVAGFFCWLLLCGSACAQFIQIPVPELPVVEEGSIAWGDYDGDGRLDLLLSGSLKLSLWRNTGNGFNERDGQSPAGLTRDVR